jgi:hypothetical protein
MQQAVTARAPAHLWIVGIQAALWNEFGCFDYFMTNTRNETYLAQFTTEQMAYFDSLPAWLTAFWAIGVWGGLAGALLLLIRSRYSVWAFALSLIGAVIAMGYQQFATTIPESMKSGAMAIMPWVIIVIAAFLLWYSWDAGKKGVLR